MFTRGGPVRWTGAVDRGVRIRVEDRQAVVREAGGRRGGLSMRVSDIVVDRVLVCSARQRHGCCSDRNTLRLSE